MYRIFNFGRLSVLSGILATALWLIPGNAEAWTFKALHSFGNGTDGRTPQFASLTQDDDGNLYGTTFEGGDPIQGCFGYGCGIVFKLAPDLSLTTLHNFADNGTDGFLPMAGVNRDESGNLYGTTCGGGKYQGGVVFKLAPGGAETIIHALDTYVEGGGVCSRLRKDKAGDLYALAQVGGQGNCPYAQGAGCGTAFKIKPDGAFIKLHDFSTDDREIFPYGNLTQDSAGNTYGITAGTEGPYWGTIFKLTPDGAETIVHTFSGGADGGDPSSGLRIDDAGNLYGAAQLGGSAHGLDGYGVVFKLSPDGTETVLHTFGAGDGNPGGIVRDKAGYLYGIVHGLGSPKGRHEGAIFRIRKDGAFRLLHRFSCRRDGCGPAGDLLLDRAGNLYGTTAGGGAYGFGTIFEFEK
jgi:uncharacterized repeat protein (TIGR03803 family)